MASTKVKSIDPAGWNHVKLKAILSQFAGKRILVIGDVGIDRYILGSVERISPEAPVPVVFVEEEKLKLGLAANVAENIKTLGGAPLLMGIVGKDRASEDFKGLLRASGIGAHCLLTDPSRRTVLKDRIVSERQQLLRVDYESLCPVASKVEAKMLKQLRSLIKRCDAIIVEDYAKGLLGESFCKSIFRLAKQNGKVVAVDPNSKTEVQRYCGASVLTPNTKEAEKLSGVLIRDEASAIEAGRKIMKLAKAQYVVITRGKDGMAIFSATSKTVQLIPTYAREVYDVSGAGDTVISVLTLALASGATIEEAAVLGNLAAGVEVGKRGTATVSPDEIRMAMDFFGAMGLG